jgi:putative phosphoesterase
LADAAAIPLLPAQLVFPITLGVLGDTHIPDRVPGLHPEILPRFQQEKVAAILHTGDISIPAVLAQLAECAPVIAVRGNRDSWRLRTLPLERTFQVGHLKIGMLHGHGGMQTYLKDSLRALFRGGLPFSYYLSRIRDALPGAQVIVFGHIHMPVNTWENDRLLFNPGSASRQISPNIPPSLGLLHLGPEGTVSGEIVYLSRLKQKQRKQDGLPAA